MHHGDGHGHPTEPDTGLLPRSAPFGRTPRDLADLPAAGDLRSMSDLFDDQNDITIDIDHIEYDHAADEERTTMAPPETLPRLEEHADTADVAGVAAQPAPPAFPGFSELVESVLSGVEDTEEQGERDILAEFGLDFEVPDIGSVDDDIRHNIEGSRQRRLARKLGLEGSDEPEPATTPPHDLDGAIDSLRLVPVSDSRAVTLLPDDALAIPLFPGVVGAVAIARNGRIEFVSEERINSWGITVSMAVSVAETNTRSGLDLRRSTVMVHDAQVIVLESDTPVTASALCWLDDIVGTALPIGSLVIAASSRLVLVQPAVHRAPEVVDTLIAFARHEALDPSDALEPTLFLRSASGLTLAGEIGSAAARLGVAATIDRLTGV